MSKAPASTAAAASWYIVVQVKSLRVVYFTDDQGYHPPMDGDWYFVSHYLGDLPEGISLRNCWSWRFDGTAFSDPGDPAQEATAESLLASNRRALHGLLKDKIDKMREPWVPAAALGETLRARKLGQARAFLSGGARGDAWPLLEGVAVARAITLREAATLIVERDEATCRALDHTERLRERLACAIDAAGTNDELVALRARLIGELDPAVTEAGVKSPNPMTPEEWDEPLSQARCSAEAARLRAQLREAVNARRRRIHDGYVDNDPLLKHKAKLAQSLLNNEGIPPAGADFSLLSGYAEARNISLEDASRLVMGTVTEAEAILRSSERDKDQFLAAIEAARTLREFHRLGQEIAALGRPGAA
jgi:hypothetical protein